jgi:hypothetical protein
VRQGGKVVGMAGRSAGEGVGRVFGALEGRTDIGTSYDLRRLSLSLSLKAVWGVWRIMRERDGSKGKQ